MTFQFWPLLGQAVCLLLLAAQALVFLYLGFVTLIKHPTKRRPPKGKAK